jgi:hypothetical protein
MDPRIDKFAIDIARLFNDFRSHVRKVYPEEYKKVLRLKEQSSYSNWRRCICRWRRCTICNTFCILGRKVKKYHILKKIY